jgi:hypothetical protein
MEHLFLGKILLVIGLQFVIHIAITLVIFHVLFGKLKKQWIENVQKQNKMNEIYNENIEISEDNFRVMNVNFNRRINIINSNLSKIMKNDKN